ncbi:phosphonate metabolism protein/1,5-bisphosphokinase (PRPP-forming) PhnN [Neoaquamicrobium sediminum]|uniref:phosphonate metabolism protein/1,5-bisphosphokinase (PRPP-forming) PhnN n=1 Tax=Neoaquamicrobium sediminum TaxID=1849104 RepID=UPI0015653432|nr:phosphonate metabolism protein/1,5-bisphosphokinase (PRPP-forming) PhnN [Mesorhizobium sediminum]NRC53409.1 phosphonate metabolism protein/1,5-bisphosphokinase (PRPP-forming) PhnN [Mesorhizobium sediminum]
MNEEPLGSGVFIPVIGPSGAGKDSLIARARQHLDSRPGFLFARRIVTRPSSPDAEDHDTLDTASFAEAEAAGAFALAWRSHGLSYGIPVSIDETILDGGVVVANVSRGVVAAIRRRYRNTLPVLVTVSRDVLAARLATRGRETAEEIASRIRRNDEYGTLDADCRVIDNSGALEHAAARFIQILEAARERDLLVRSGKRDRETGAPA